MKLSPSMSVAAFDRGYWYLAELSAFAKRIGVARSGALRKNELEAAIKTFLKSGSVIRTRGGRPPISGIRDVERGLSLDLPVVTYTNDARTKAFVEREAATLSPGLERRSGARYRFNRWREKQLARGRRITYRDLVREWIRLNRDPAPFTRIPHGRYINFVADFLAAEEGATRARAIRAWKELKVLDVPKDYRSWKKATVGR